jgi:hypothetical protein
MFTPPLSPPDLARNMQASQIFFFSSRYESFGLAATEAAACGCALVGPSEISVLGNSTISVKHSFWRSPLNLLTQKLQAASASPADPTSLIEAAHLSSPTKIATMLLDW